MISKCIGLILCCSIYSFPISELPQVIRIGGIYPITNIVTAKININGAQWLAGSLMAMRDLNANPIYAANNIQFKLAVRDSRKTFSNTVVGCLALAQTVFQSSGSHVIVGAGEKNASGHLFVFVRLSSLEDDLFHFLPSIPHFNIPRFLTAFFLLPAISFSVPFFNLIYNISLSL